jgi:hypothetical protein
MLYTNRLLSQSGRFSPVPAWLVLPVPRHEESDGSVTRRYTYDYRNRIIRVEAKSAGQYSTVATYEYDGLNRRVRKSLDSGPDVDALLRKARNERDAYLRWGRNVMGWAMYLFQKL